MPFAFITGVTAKDRNNTLRRRRSNSANWSMPFMKITIESTNEFVSINGVRCRMWDGSTESGIPVQAAIGRVAPRRTPTMLWEACVEAFEREAIAAGFRPPSHPESRAQQIVDVPPVHVN